MKTVLTNGAINRSVPLVDRFAIGLSTLCLVHCLFMPILVLSLPSLTHTIFGSEALHLWMVYAVIPSSLFALAMGCKQHKQSLFIFTGILGLSFLIFGVSVHSLSLDHHWEKISTIIGTLLIAFSHALNLRECKKTQNCCAHKKNDLKE